LSSLKLELGAGGGQECQENKKKSFDEEMIAADVALERENEEMKRLDEMFEEKTQKLVQMAGRQQSALSLPGMEKGSKFVMVDKQSSRLTDKGGNINDKAQARKVKTNDLGNTSNPLSIFSNFHLAHFVNAAQSCGIKMRDDTTSALDVINTMEAQEKAQAMLNEARIRKEREIQLEKEKTKQLVRIDDDDDDDDDNIRVGYTPTKESDSAQKETRGVGNIKTS
jgi:hypothetical protein